MLLPVFGAFAFLALVVLGIVVATQYERSQPGAPAVAAHPVHMSSAVAVASRAQRIHIQAAVLIKAAVDRTSTAVPPFNGYLYDMRRSKAFARSWRSVMSRLPAGVRARNPWLVTLETTAAPNEAIETVSGGRYILAWGCDPSGCAARSVQLVYNVSTSAVAASVFLNGARHTLGSTAIDDRATLLAQMACERLGRGERIPLRALDVEKADRFIESTSLE